MEPSQTAGQPSSRRRFSIEELVADGIVHGVGLAAALGAGGVMLAVAVGRTAPNETAALAIYVASLVVVLSVSMAYNLWPMSRIKSLLARLDQAAIFLFIAGSYTPFLALLGGATAMWLMVAVWVASLVGMALKLTIPGRFGRAAIPFYLGIGWSGVLAYQQIVANLPVAAGWMLVAGGVLYSIGLVFHLWEKLRFQNVVWHGFVVVAALVHMAAMVDCLITNRL